MSEERLVATPHGEGRLQVHRASRCWLTVLLSHGAGGGIESPDLAVLARSLRRHGVTVLLFEQPWRRAGRRIATAPPTLDEALVAASDTLRVRTPLVVGGRSAGARSAARTAQRLGASGVLALSFPLHPPDRPERSRLPELLGVRVPTLVIQGERDPMGRPEEFPASTDLVVIPGADHQLRVPARGPLTREEAESLLVESTLEWLVRAVVGSTGNDRRR